MRIRFLLLSLAAACAAVAQPLDLLITNGRVVDGSGNPWYNADVGIRGGAIVEIGKLSGRSAKRTIDARGQVVAPGFVDLMGGRSLPLLLDPDSAASKLRQGITTMFAGEGSSDAPHTDQTFPQEARRAGYNWRTYGEYFQVLEKRGIALNVVHNVGAAQIRRIVLGDEDRAPNAEELKRMQALVSQAMRDGAVGVSTALIYPPGTYAKTEELVALARAAGEYGGIYSTHMRNESSALLEAIAESIEIGEKAGVPVHIYHLKAAGQDNWPLMPKAIEAIRAARARGLDVTADIYPYIRNGLGLGSFLHPRHYARGSAPFLKTLDDPAVRERLRREVETTTDWENWYRHVGSDWDNVLIASAADKSYEGKSVAEVAKMRNADVWATFFDLVRNGRTSVNPKSMDEAQKHLAMRADFVSFCTDASPTNQAKATGAHPRAFGSFPRILAKYVREEQVVSLEEAIRKMTSLAANRVHVYDRGRIAVGQQADIVIFDPARIRDTADFTNPLGFPEHLPYVIVNGQVAVDDGRMTAVKAGRALRARR
ncbi:MAG: D-aminoacylase [Bryobacterales bacterium]|nr:D-aminoacylase [Bryobacterales bacterium]